jgi:colanic acid/amylovoran biosynthesis glycosyltransferase
MMDTDESILLVLPVPIQIIAGEMFIEPQAANGLERWLENFEKVTVCCPLDTGPRLVGSRAISTLIGGERLAIEKLRAAWSPFEFLRLVPSYWRRFDELIAKHRYLQFAIGGAWGDWGLIAATAASKRGRQFAIWTDRVESMVMRRAAKDYSGIRYVYRRINAQIAAASEKWIIRRSSLGLFHGMDTFEAYSPYCKNPQLVHDIHMKSSDQIESDALFKKVQQSLEGPLRIIYAGRLHPDKGPSDWLKALHVASQLGADFEAIWYGDGPCLEEFKSLCVTYNLQQCVRMPGQVSDRTALLNALKTAHIMVFCHLTPESPRCLIEALICGTPIVGYGSPYSKDLISCHGGGVLVDWKPESLARAIKSIADNRTFLQTLIKNAAKDGLSFNDEHVFVHRSELIKRYA